MSKLYLFCHYQHSRGAQVVSGIVNCTIYQIRSVLGVISDKTMIISTNLECFNPIMYEVEAVKVIFKAILTVNNNEEDIDFDM